MAKSKTNFGFGQDIELCYIFFFLGNTVVLSFNIFDSLICSYLQNSH